MRKLSAWLLALGAVIVCLSCWAMVHITETSLHDQRIPGPAITNLVTSAGGWILAVPVPWLIWAAKMNLSRVVKSDEFLLFSSSLLLALAVLACASGIAVLLPLIPFKA